MEQAWSSLPQALLCWRSTISEGQHPQINRLRMAVSGVPKITPRADDSLEDSQDSASQPLVGCDLLPQKDTGQHQQRGKAHGPKSGGNQTQVFQGPFPVESHRVCFLPPAVSRDNTSEVLSTREAHWRETQCPGFFLEAGIMCTLCLARTKLYLLQRKADAQNKPHGLYKLWRHRKPHLSVRDSGETPEIRFPEASQVWPCKEASV